MKKCQVCQSLFQPKSGINKFCSEQCKGKWKYISGIETTESQYERISGNWKAYFTRLCTQKGRESLEVNTLLEILDLQKHRCLLTGIELTCKLEKGIICKTNASIDRIQSGGPYIKENIQLVCRAVNSWRGDTDLTEFIWWCKQVTLTQEGKE